MIILVAGLQGLQKELKEAAYTFGANKWQILKDITLIAAKAAVLRTDSENSSDLNISFKFSVSVNPPSIPINTSLTHILDTAIVSGVPSTEYSDWNAVKLLYGDIFNEILNTIWMP